MALAPSFTVVQNDGGLTALATNTTTYGGANQDRNEAAEYVLWSKTDKDGNRVFTNPDQGDVLTNLLYTVATLVSGLYELIWLRIQPYSNVTAYVSGNVVYSAGVVYRCIASTTGNAPPNGTYWEVIAFENLYTLLGNTSIEEYIKNVDILYHINKGITGRIADQGCNCQGSDKEYNMNLFSDYISATSNFNAGNIYEFEAIIEQLNTACVEC